MELSPLISAIFTCFPPVWEVEHITSRWLNSCSDMYGDVFSSPGDDAKATVEAGYPAVELRHLQVRPRVVEGNTSKYFKEIARNP